MTSARADRPWWSPTAPKSSRPGGEFVFAGSLAEAIAQAKAAAGGRQVHVMGGADLIRQALDAGLVDELQLFLVPVIVGGGKRALPNGVRSDLELLDTQRFASGAVYLRYRPTPA